MQPPSASLVSLAAALMLSAAAAGCQAEAAPPQAAAPTSAAVTKKHRIVYHLSDPAPEKAKFVMGNVQNTITGLGGFQNFDALEVVVHGPAVKNFLADTIDPDLKAAVAKLVAQGVTMTICGNTITKLNIDPNQLVSGCSIAKQGGVVRLIELQEQGYAYMRP